MAHTLSSWPKYSRRRRPTGRSARRDARPARATHLACSGGVPAAIVGTMARHPPLPARPAPTAPGTDRADRRLSPLAAALPARVPFVGPEALERAAGRPFSARLGANESLFGPSPLAVAAMAEAAGEAWKYGDPEGHDLRVSLAAHHGVAPANIVLGEGIDGLLGYLVRLYAGPGDAVVTSRGAYPTFDYHVAGFGAALPMRSPIAPTGRNLPTGRWPRPAHRAPARPSSTLPPPPTPMGRWPVPRVSSAAARARCRAPPSSSSACGLLPRLAPAGALPRLAVAAPRACAPAPLLPSLRALPVWPRGLRASPLPYGLAELSRACSAPFGWGASAHGRTR